MSRAGCHESATDTEALEAFALCSRLEGIIPALEPSHALAYAGKILPDLPPDHIVVMNMCGRGDKDLEAVLPRLEDVGLLAHELRSRPARPHVRRLERARRPGDIRDRRRPRPRDRPKILAGLPSAGADMIEFGMPFSDPMADGPSIQASSLRALKAGATLASTLDMLRLSHRRCGHTVVLMGYYNPIYSYGVEAFWTTPSRLAPTA